MIYLNTDIGKAEELENFKKNIDAFALKLIEININSFDENIGGLELLREINSITINSEHGTLQAEFDVEKARLTKIYKDFWDHLDSSIAVKACRNRPPA